MDTEDLIREFERKWMNRLSHTDSMSIANKLINEFMFDLDLIEDSLLDDDEEN